MLIRLPKLTFNNVLRSQPLCGNRKAGARQQIISYRTKKQYWGENYHQTQRKYDDASYYREKYCERGYNSPSRKSETNLPGAKPKVLHQHGKVIARDRMGA